jgi:hypothetical protein
VNTHVAVEWRLAATFALVAVVAYVIGRTASRAGDQPTAQWAAPVLIIALVGLIVTLLLLIWTANF